MEQEKKINNTLDSQVYDLIKDIYENGEISENRTGIKTRSLFGKSIRINLSEGLPILTYRHHSFKIAFYETMMFLNGETDTIKWLENNNIFIWSGNTSREFLDNKGLTDLPVGDIGMAYGKLWNDFDGVNQLDNVFNTLKENPNDRRMVVSAWHPARIHEAALPPCHILYQFYVKNNKLSCQVYMRSLDVWNGLGYDIMAYGLITSLFAKALNLDLGDLIFVTGDTHLYENGNEQYEKFLKDFKYNDLPKLEIIPELNTLDDIRNLKYEDIKIHNYKSANKYDKVDMAI